MGYQHMKFQDPSINGTGSKVVEGIKKSVANGRMSRKQFASQTFSQVGHKKG